MTRDEVLAMTDRELDRAIGDLLGDCWEAGWIVSADGHRIASDDGGPRYYSGRDCLIVMERFGLTVTPKRDPTEKSRWLADIELKGPAQLWWGFGSTIGIAVCRAVLLRRCE